MMRRLLIMGGMDPEVALTFTLHSWRHLFPTTARQLRLSDTEQVEIGRWSVGPAMPRRYDSAACVTELTAKSAICSAFNKGWSLVEGGCIALPPPVSVPFPPTPPPPLVPPSSMNQPNWGMVGPKHIEILDLWRQASNINDGETHIWKGGEKTVCRSWQCGAPDNPRPFAKFMGVGVFVPDCIVTPQCRICFSEKLKFLRVPPEQLKTGHPSSSSGSEGESSLASASMDSDDSPGIAPPVETTNNIVMSLSASSSSDDDKPVR